MSGTALLSLNNLSVWYTAGHPVLSGLSLDLGEHEVVGLIGLNGAGKTTFIKTVAGLLPGCHLDEATWDGHPFSFRDKAFKRSRYIVFAEDRSFPHFTFREYLAYVAASYGVALPDVTGLVKGFHFEDYINTAGLAAVAGFLPLLFGEVQGMNMFPIGLAILCLNTPICTLLSCDPDLEQAIRVLPGQAGRFCRKYCLFIFAINSIVACIYLCSWQLINGGAGFFHGITLLLFALQSAILSVVLEWRYPIRGWKTESDLWHHPRKYLVPLIMLLAAALVGIWPPALWIWAAALLTECCVLLVVTRRD